MEEKTTFAKLLNTITIIVAVIFFIITIAVIIDFMIMLNDINLS